MAVGEPELLAGTGGMPPVLVGGAAVTGVAPGEAPGLLAGEAPGYGRSSMSALMSMWYAKPVATCLHTKSASLIMLTLPHGQQQADWFQRHHCKCGESKDQLTQLPAGMVETGWGLLG